MSLYSLVSTRSLFVFSSFSLIVFLIYKWKLELELSALGIIILFAIIYTPCIWYYLAHLYSVIIKENHVIIRSEHPLYRDVVLPIEAIETIDIIEGTRRLDTLRIIMKNASVKTFTIDPLWQKKRSVLGQALSACSINQRVAEM